VLTLELTSHEVYTLKMLLKVEIDEVEYLIATTSEEEDKKELSYHLNTVKEINKKLM